MPGIMSQYPTNIGPGGFIVPGSTHPVQMQMPSMPIPSPVPTAPVTEEEAPKQSNDWPSNIAGEIADKPAGSEGEEASCFPL